MMKLIMALIGGIATKKLASSGSRAFLAMRSGDEVEALKQTDRLASALGWMASLGILGGMSLSKGQRERMSNALSRF